MLNETNEFEDLSVWQTATLYLGFLDQNEPTGEIVAHITNKSNQSTNMQESWKKLREAVEEKNIHEIKSYAVELHRESDLPWPLKWRKRGELCHKMLRRFSC